MGPCARRAASSQAPIADSDRPDLFYHLVSFPRSVYPSSSASGYMLSFLLKLPPSQQSSNSDWMASNRISDHRRNVLRYRAVRQGLWEGVGKAWTNMLFGFSMDGWIHMVRFSRSVHAHLFIPTDPSHMHKTDSCDILHIGRIGDPDAIIDWFNACQG
ncbi:hypothetical protein EDD17DRAFT_654245 [Pisolithus thermaeus]|nr:hypothetical protein EDD17DRAFT_654245 [Pisolithus thermaeus]